MVNVQQKLQEASDKYGAKEIRFRSKIKSLFTYLDRNKCTQALESCRNDVQDALAALPVSGRGSCSAGYTHQIIFCLFLGPMERGSHKR